jgi:hypothetical protein
MEADSRGSEVVTLDGPTASGSEKATDEEDPAARPVSPGSFEEFDLTPYRVQLKSARRHELRLLVVLGLAFTAAGVTASAFGTAEAGFSWTIAFVVVAIFTGGGFLPLLLLYVPSREWRYPRKLRIEGDGFRIVDSGGTETRFKWEQPGLVISIRKTEPTSIAGSKNPIGEMLLTIPYALCAIPKEARQSLLIESEANGLTVAVDHFDVSDDTPAGRPAPSVTYTAMRVARDAPTLAVPTPSRTGPVDPVAPGTVFEFPEEVAQGPEQSWDVPSKNPLKSLSFSAEGFTIELRNRRSRRYDWSNSHWGAELSRRLETPLEPLENPRANWHLSLRSPIAEGDLTSEAYDALVAEARRAGRDVISARLPSPVPPHSFWTVETSVRPHPRGR